MLVLLSSPASPFGRKVKIAASVLGLLDRIKVENTSTTDPDDNLRKQNPLGKIPALILEDGSTLYDSRVIVEYLDHLAGGNRIFPAGEARFAALRNQAMADGMMDAGILQVYEKRFRPDEYRYPDWLAYQAQKVERALKVLEVSLPAAVRAPEDLDVGSIALACALGYLDLRFNGDWRATCPRLASWVDDVEQAVPIFAKTKLPSQPVAGPAEPLR
ncbi:glutathione S-transferase family protein [Roseibium sp.]|uniref:glutathione S-transferase family protein n=1 Tax=Roseibium sp. TaxID=1936156 RepID=UPI003A976857